MNTTGFILYGLFMFLVWVPIGWWIGRERVSALWTAIIHIIVIVGMFFAHYLVFTEMDIPVIWSSRIFTILGYFVGFYWRRGKR